MSSCAGSAGDRYGVPCKHDDDCGPGYDCYNGTCHHLCTPDEPCAAGFVCEKFRCLPRADSAPAPASTGAPATAEDVRAMRRELERIRFDLDRLLKAQGIEPTPPPPAYPSPPAQASPALPSRKAAPRQPAPLPPPKR